VVPPVPLITAVLIKMMQERALAVLVGPLNPRARYWPLLQRLRVSPLVRLDELCAPGRTPLVHPLPGHEPPAWTPVVVRVCGRRTLSRT
jgi:hypothetical protein